MNPCIFTLSPVDVIIDRREAAKYMKSPADELTFDLIDRAFGLVREKLSPRACYIAVDVNIDKGFVDLGFGAIESRDFARFIGQARTAYLFAATIGIEADRVISRLGVTDPAMAYAADSVCSAAIEFLCASLCEKLSAGRRYSPGYGDFPLEYQKSILTVLDAAKTVGLTLTDSYMMIPSKSVTAIAVG